MMDAEDSVARHISPLFGGRVYQEKTPSKMPELPFAIIRLTRQEDLEVLGGATSTEIVRLQVDVYDKDTTSLKTSARRVRDSLRLYPDTTLLGAFNLPEPNENLYRRVHDYRVIHYAT